jgi:hypothetical protein
VTPIFSFLIMRSLNILFEFIRCSNASKMILCGRVVAIKPCAGIIYIYGNVWYVSVYRKCWYRRPKECSWSASCGCLLVITFSNSRPAAPFVQIFPHPLQNLLIIILLCPTQCKPSRTYYIRRNITHVYERAALKIREGEMGMVLVTSTACYRWNEVCLISQRNSIFIHL